MDAGHHPAEPGAIAASGMIANHPVLHARTRQAAGAQLFVSLHHDSVKQRYLAEARKFSGFSLFVSRLNPAPDKSLACASAIGSRLRGAGLAPSRYHADAVFGESRPFADEVNGVHFYDNLAVARTATMPSVLVEAGVIVNPDEERRLDDAAARRRIAQAIARGVRECLP